MKTMIKKSTKVYKNLEYVKDFNFPKYTTFQDCMELKLGKNVFDEDLNEKLS